MRIISKKEARSLGLQKYFTGEPCLYGHISERYVSNGCVECVYMKNRNKTPEQKRRHRELTVRWKQENPDYYREWNDKHRDRVQLSGRKWRKNNPEMVRRKSHNRRAKKHQVGGVYTLEDINRIRRLQRNKCAYCHVRLNAKNEHIDHIIALSNGGTNNPCNLQLLCGGCNLEKTNRDPIIYARTLGLLV